MTNANFQRADDVFDGWRDDVLTGSPPVLFPIGFGCTNGCTKCWANAYAAVHCR